MNIYVASSWRNGRQPEVVKRLREAGHDVYDFRNLQPGSQGFNWSQIDPNWQTWTAEEYRKALSHSIAVEGFRLNYQAMEQADVFVLVMPCGASAHLEAGWGAGRRRPTAILLAPGEPELMYKLADLIAVDIEEVVVWLDKLKAGLHDDCCDWCYVHGSESESQCPWFLASKRLDESALLKAVGHNRPDGYSSKTEAIDICDSIELEILGAKNRADWVWVVRLRNGRFAYARGGCDFTGWDCHSGICWEEAETIEQAIRLAEEDARPVLEEMLAAGEKRRKGLCLKELWYERI